MKTPKGVLFLFLACLCACGVSARAEVGFSFSLKYHGVGHRLAARPKLGISTFGEKPILPANAANLTESTEYDSLFTRATLLLRVKETDILQPLVLEYAEYRDLRYQWDVRKAFAEVVKTSFKQQVQDRSGEGIAIDVPFRIKSKAFRRIFGGDNIGLRVQGNITIDGKIRQQKFDELQTANQRNSNTNFNIDMTQRFTIAGKIGEKVQVDVNQDSERLFDFENSLKLTYTGNPDEIVQKIEAGNVNLSLGTSLATFSGQNKGLFGLKTEAKIGALKLTGIASLERGQKNRQEPNKDQRGANWTENEFVRNTYFWLTERDTTIIFRGDTLDVSGFRENYRRIRGRYHVDAAFPLAEIEVWVSSYASGTQTDVNTNSGVAVVLDSLSRLDDYSSISSESAYGRKGQFRRLEPLTDYEFVPRAGYIRLKRALQTDDFLAVAFVTEQGDEFGRMRAPQDSLELILIKNNITTRDNNPTWNLMFRHVYSMQAQNLSPENFEIEIIREAAGGAVDETGPDNTMSYLTMFQFDTEGPNGAAQPDKYLDNYPAIVNWTYGELHFLDLTPFYPSGYIDDATGETVFFPLRALDSTRKANLDSTTVLDSSLYSLPDGQITQAGVAWRFKTKTLGTTSQYDLGALVLEGSEEVTLNGVPLIRGTDYTIDYLSGQLKILNESAKAPNANLVITYESGQVFQLDRKTLLGARAEYELWENSYIGGMVLKLDEKSLDKRVRIGNEPISNSLVDLNTQLKFKPRFLTALADRLPLVSTNVESDFTIDGEVAKVYPNPNSLTNDATGDANGVAYLDDFEASRRSAPLGLLRRNWTIASIPVDPNIDSLRGVVKWWNPRSEDQVPVQDVYPNRQTNSQVADRLQSLKLDFTPDTSTGRPEESWGGVMRYLGTGYEDQSRAQFLEFWLQVEDGDSNGYLVVDLGTISEDALPNDTMDSEDTPLPGEVTSSPTREYGNGILNTDPNEDSGIDSKFGENDYDFWNGPSRDSIPSNDNWSYDIGSNVFEQINGTEGNKNDEGGNIPDSEDLNGNQNLDLTNIYTSYRIPLKSNSEFVVGGLGAREGWRLYRIPIDISDPNVRRTVPASSAPNLTNVRWARMYITGVRERTTIEMVQNDIVSNEWLPEFVNGDSTEYVSTAVINTHENTGPDDTGYQSPPGVQGEQDPVTGLRQREQSLVLDVERLDGSGRSAPREFYVSKNLYQQINMLEYRRLKMFIHGGGIDEALYPDGQCQVILRLGTNYTNVNTNYYEIVKTIYRGWDSRNHIDITMNDLSILRKLREDAGRLTGDTTAQDNLRRFAVLLDSTKFANDSLVINGTPSLQNVGFIALGVRAAKHNSIENAEIWADELRVSDIYKDPGVAGEIATSLKIADLVTFAASYNKQDADFHNVNQRTGSLNGSETMQGTMNLNVAKFGLERFGFSLPLVVTRHESESVPKYIPNTDVRINQNSPPDSVIRKESRTTYTASYTKTGNSPNPLVRWTMERLRLNWDHSKIESRDHTYKYSRQTQTGARADYTFPTASGRGLAPLVFLRDMPLLSMLGSPKLYYKPKQLSGSFAAQRAEAASETRQGRKSSSPNFAYTGSGNLGWDITDAISSTMGQTFGWSQISLAAADTNNDGRADTTTVASPWSKIRPYRGNQNAEGWNWTNTYSPQFGRWFAPSFNYNTTYNWSGGNRRGSSNASDNQTVANNRVIGGDLTLDFKQVFGGGRDGGRRGPRPEPVRPKAQTDSTATDSTATDSTAIAEQPRGPGFSPLAVLGTAFKPLKIALLTIEPVALSYDNSLRHSRGGMTGQASLPYRLGFSTNPDADTSDVSVTAQLSESNDYSARSGLRISKDIRTMFTWNRRETSSLTTTQTGDNEETAFWLADKGTGDVGTEFPFADITMDWAGFERISFVSKAARTVSLNSSLTSRVKNSWQNNTDNIVTRTYNRQWSPLIGVNISWLNDMDTQLRYNATNSLTRSESQGTAQRGNGSGVSGTVGYTMRTGFRLPLLWFGALRLQNQTTLSLNLDYQNNKQEQSRSGEFSPQRDEVQWSVQPRITYSFSNTVNGGLNLQYQQTKDKISDRGSRLFEFGVNVNIAIRG